MKIDYNKHIWEGWTVKMFITDLEPSLDMIMNKNSWQKPFNSKEEIKKWCMDMQPGYKKYIPEVVNHFAQKYNLK
jgi:hypothetical protein